MFISSISIENFKCIKEATFEFDPHFNLIIGGNNSGKSTVFEALRLWQLAFNKFLKDRTNNQKSSFYASQYFSFTLDDIRFLRIDDLAQLFHKKDKSKKVRIKVTLSNNDKKIELPISFSLTTEARNIRFELLDKPEASNPDNNDETSYREEASRYLLVDMLSKPQGTSLKNMLLITYINPIFQLPINEPKYSDGFIVKQLQNANVSNVLRNLIDIYAPKKHTQIKTRTKNKNQRLSKLEDDLFSILDSTRYSFLSDFKHDKDPYLDIVAVDEGKNTEVELSQLGSGTINVLNILSVIAYGEREKIPLSILLLDEPDSHLHSNYQNNLFDYLKKVSCDEDKQVFIITHNHELISNADKVLFVPKLDKKCLIKAIGQDEYCEKVFKNISKEYYKSLVEAKRVKECQKNRIAKLEKELKELYPNKVFVCEDEGGRTIWEYLLETFDIKDVKVIPSKGCTNKEPLIVLKDKIKNRSNYNPKIIRELDRDGFLDDQIEIIKNKTKNELWEIAYLPVNEIENFALLVKTNKDDIDKLFKDDETMTYNFLEEFQGTAETNLRALKKAGYEETAFNEKQKYEMFKFANSNKIKYLNGKELCKIMGIDADSVLKNLKKEDFPEDLTNYLNIVKSYFEGD